MIASSKTHQPLQAILALAMMLPLGCDTTEIEARDGLVDPVAALELSPNQDVVEDPEIVAFEAIESFDIEADVQAFGAGCTLLRPASWRGPGVNCVEYYKAPGAPADTLPMYDGQSFITSSGLSGPGLGTGEARISCNDGAITIQKLSCVPGGVTP